MKLLSNIKNHKQIASALMLLLLKLILFSGLFNISCQSFQKTPYNIKKSQKKLFSFGIIADTQWGDKDKEGNRHYRKALDKLKECVAVFNKEDLRFTIQLGDIIDGHNTVKESRSDLEKVADVYNKLTMPHYSVIGNHCTIAGKEYVMKTLKMKKEYYDFSFQDIVGWRFIVLDGMDEGTGVLGKEQLKWCKKILDFSSKKEENVIIFNHFALLKSSAKKHRMEKPEPLLKLIEKYPCVVAYFAGHDHEGGYSLQNGIHHITLKGMLESPIKNAYAIVDVYPTKLVENGFGNEPSRELNIEQVPNPIDLSAKHWKIMPELTDEFEQPNLDLEKWYDHNPEWKGRKPGFFLKSNVSVSDGKLHLTARVDNLLHMPKGYHSFTTAAVQSKTRVKYGYFEAKCKPMNSRASSAFWMYYNSPGYWTEIDVFEICGKSLKEEKIYHMNAHVFESPTFKRKGSIKNRLTHPGSWKAPFRFADNYHIYGLEWTKDYLKWYVDGKLVRIMKNRQWHQPLTINFDSETFPDWFGLPKKSNLPSTFSIEYIRSWKEIIK